MDRDDAWMAISYFYGADRVDMIVSKIILEEIK